MIPEIISFSKSMACRRQEFQSLLYDIETPCSEINEVWSSIFNDLCIPKLGWLALWIVSEENCVNYNLIHPTAVIVKVEEYDQDMSAFVSVMGVQDDIILPSQLNVPLIELHPIKTQEYDKDDLKIIANWLDKCRYFFKYLWYPWDAKMNVKLSEWCMIHLENRLKIQCDIQNGLFEKNVSNYYKSLLRESWKIEDSLNKAYLEDAAKGERINVMNNCIRRKILKLELEFFEDAELRNDLITLRVKKPALGECKKTARFVWDGGDVDTLITHLTSAKALIDNDISLKVSSSFQEALDNSNPNEIILLSPGSHLLKSSVDIQSGVTIKGFGKAEETEVVADSSVIKKAILFECFGEFNFQNLTVRQKEGIAIQICEKNLKISNCVISGNRHPGTRGIVVLSGCTLVLENCEIYDFGVGIAMLKGSSALISNTRVHGCLGGIKVSEESELVIKNAEISNCSEYAVRLESSEEGLELPLAGDIDLLSKYSGNKSRFDLESVIFKNNIKCNIIIDRSLDKFNSCLFDTDILNESSTNSDANLSN